MLCGDLNGKKIQRGDIYICTDDSLCCTAKTNTTLQSNYTSIKKTNKQMKEAQQRFPALSTM